MEAEKELSLLFSIQLRAKPGNLSWTAIFTMYHPLPSNNDPNFPWGSYHLTHSQFLAHYLQG